MVEFVKDVLESGRKYAAQKQYAIGKLTDRAVSDIEKLINIDVSEFEHFINGGHIVHIKERHGEQGKADQSMKNPEDIGRVKYVLDNYDFIQLLKEPNQFFLNSDGTPAKMIQYTKRINGYYFVIEVVPDTKKKKLWIISLFKNNTTNAVNAVNSRK